MKTIEHLNQRRIRLEEEYSTGFKRAQADFAEWAEESSTTRQGKSDDEQKQSVLVKYGLAGYGLYWHWLSLLLKRILKTNASFGTS